MFVSRWCYKSGSLNVIRQFSHDVIGWKTRVKFVISHWWVSIRLLLVKLVGLVCPLLVDVVSRVRHRFSKSMMSSVGNGSLTVDCEVYMK